MTDTNALAIIPGFKSADKRSLNGGEQVIVEFENGYGASVVRHAYSYGTELAVVHGNRASNAPLCYATPVTSDVIGHIADQEELRSILTRIAVLPRNDECTHSRVNDWDYEDDEEA